ncbi:hypothetical protein FZC83_15795 [Rossellomorea marisflavi]|uniref:Uncharacterized protein n=1 Tax=Rossellomorea marisflavi TaxID=189381 RepID=A0A5D4RQA2_9BACI|nr:hypothetical protein [Rossellomorea marisflavi]TYS53150.1 hypothetical protein FZC83_15795 [Rossellomorea marisflavi]
MDKRIVVKAFLILLVVMMAVLHFAEVMTIPNEVLSAVLGVSLVLLVVYKFYKARRDERRDLD